MVTSRLLEAFLACPVKCYLLSKQELPAGTEYPTWATAREDSYRQASVLKLTIPETKPYIASPEPGVWKGESWQFAVAKTVRAEGWEAEIAMIQQVPQAGSLSRFVPIRFVANNRLTSSDLVFGRDSVKRRVVQYMFQGYRCRSCRHEYGLSEWYLHARKWGWNVVAYFVYNVVGLRVPQLTMQHSLNRLFGFNLVRSTLNNLKIKAAERYLLAKRKILERIVGGDLVHADETRANIKGHLAYVWVLTNMTEVAYVLAESREAEIVHDLLKDFKGVLVSDFYAAYDSIPCPQQKCLIHLMRDLNDEILNNPFNQEMKSICLGFTGLLKPIVETVDRHGLKKRFLRKHLVDVNRFFGFLEATQFTSEAALKCKQRFEKNRGTTTTPNTPSRPSSACEHVRPP